MAGEMRITADRMKQAGVLSTKDEQVILSLIRKDFPSQMQLEQAARIIARATKEGVPHAGEKQGAATTVRDSGARPGEVTQGKPGAAQAQSPTAPRLRGDEGKKPAKTGEEEEKPTRPGGGVQRVGEFTKSDQGQYRLQKAQLTKAQNAKDWPKVIALADTFEKHWEQRGIGVPDDWARWQRAKEDAQLELRRAPIAKPSPKVTPQVPPIEGVTPLGRPPAKSLLDEQAKKDLDDALGGLMASVPQPKALKGTKVVDENGNPKMVFHGTTKAFEEFDPAQRSSSLLGAGFHFAEDAAVASRYAMQTGAPGANVRPVFLDIKNPAPPKVVDAVRKDEAYDRAGTTSLERETFVRDTLVKRGYDGLWYEHMKGYGKTWVPFDVSQIKPAFVYRLTRALAASVPKPPELEQKEIPPEKLPAFIKAAQSMIRSGVDTPEKLVAEIPEKARPYLQAIWDAMGMVRKDLRAHTIGRRLSLVKRQRQRRRQKGQDAAKYHPRCSQPLVGRSADETRGVDPARNRKRR